MLMQFFKINLNIPSAVLSALLFTLIWTMEVKAESPNDIYSKRVLPLLQSASSSSCSECHFKGVQLSDFLTEDAKQSFASLRARGWIDIQDPSKSKIIQFISRKSDSPDALIDKVREAELSAITAWVSAAVKDPELLNEPLPKHQDLQIATALVRHMRKDQLVNRFINVMWSQLERCANCHSPDRNQKQVEKNGEQMSWIVPSAPDKTLALLLERSLIDVEDPEIA